MKEYKECVSYEIITGEGTVLTSIENKEKAIEYLNTFPLKEGKSLLIVKTVQKIICERKG